jgi:hypothetical protein
MPDKQVDIRSASETPAMLDQGEERSAVLMIQGWHGYSECPCTVVGQTPKKYRIVFVQKQILPGRRVAEAGVHVLVPKHAIRFV